MADEPIVNEDEPKVVPEDGTLVNQDDPAPVEDEVKPEDKTDEGDEPKEDEPKEEEPKEDDTDQESESDEDLSSGYNEYSNPALKQAVNLLIEAKLPVEEANAIFQEAVDTGDLSKINKQALIDKIGKDKADVVLVLAESYYNTEFSGMKAIKEGIHELVGGEDNFTDMRTWANDKAKKDPEFAKDFAEFKAMFDSGQPRSINAAAKELFELYKQDPSTTIKANLEVGDKSVGSAGVEPMTRAQYTDAVEKAHKAGTYESQRAALWARRSAGLNKGI